MKLSAVKLIQHLTVGWLKSRCTAEHCLVSTCSMAFFRMLLKILLYVLRLSVSVRNMLILLQSASNASQVSKLTQHKAVMVKSQSQLWPTPSESIAIYCARKLVSCVTHLQSLSKMILKGRMCALYAILLLFFCLMLRKVVMFTFYDTSRALQVSGCWAIVQLGVKFCGLCAPLWHTLK